jgi:transcriptional regulator
MGGSDIWVGTLDLLILKALTGGQLHGYAIGQWIRSSTSEVLKVQEGVLYPALYRLERKGWVAEEWGITETKREAKFYRLTPAGRKHLKSELARWREHTRAVNAALET